MRTHRSEPSECPEAPRSRTFPEADVGADADITLVETMAVLLVPAILPALAIPTFLGVTTSADHRVTRSNLNIALIATDHAGATTGQLAIQRWRLITVSFRAGRPPAYTPTSSRPLTCSSEPTLRSMDNSWLSSCTVSLAVWNPTEVGTGLLRVALRLRDGSQA